MQSSWRSGPSPAQWAYQALNTAQNPIFSVFCNSIFTLFNSLFGHVMPTSLLTVTYKKTSLISVLTLLILNCGSFRGYDHGIIYLYF